jgi:hypothetical protein
MSTHTWFSFHGLLFAIQFRFTLSAHNIQPVHNAPNITELGEPTVSPSGAMSLENINALPISEATRPTPATIHPSARKYASPNTLVGEFFLFKFDV